MLFGLRVETGDGNKWKRGTRNGVQGLRLLCCFHCDQRLGHVPLRLKGCGLSYAEPLVSPSTIVQCPWEELQPNTKEPG